MNTRVQNVLTAVRANTAKLAAEQTGVDPKLSPADDGTTKQTEGAHSQGQSADLAQHGQTMVENQPEKPKNVSETDPVTGAATTGNSPSGEMASASTSGPTDTGTAVPGMDASKEASVEANFIEPIRKMASEEGLAATMLKLAAAIDADLVEVRQLVAKEAAEHDAAVAEMQKLATEAGLTEADEQTNIEQIVKRASEDADMAADDLEGYLAAEQESAEAPEGEASAPAAEAMPAEAVPADAASADAGAMLGGEGGSEEEMLAALSQALDEAGVTPEEFIAAVEQSVTADPAASMQEKQAAVVGVATKVAAVNAYRNRCALRPEMRKQAKLSTGIQMLNIVRSFIPAK